MASRFFKHMFFPALVAFSIGFGAVSFAAEGAAKNLSASDVEKIVHDYIVNNPQVILTAVDDYQKKSMQARFSGALEANKDTVFKDRSSPETGNPKGDVTVVEFFDYNCGYCKRVLPMVQALLEKDKNVRVVLKDFPILGPASDAAAKWALAAQKQDKYFEFHRTLMDSKEPINDESLQKVAAGVGMDVNQAKKDVEGTAILLQIEKNRALAGKLGLSGTPAFIIGDEIIPGAISLEQMQGKIEELRKNKKK